MFKYITKQLKRSIITNALFCILLTLSGTLLCISAGLWYSAYKALSDIDETITTIAIPNRNAINKHAVNITDVNTTDREEAIIQNENEIFRRIREEIYPSGLFQKDERRFFNAFAEDISPVPLYTSGVGAEPFFAAHSGQELAAFIVTCETITNNHYLSGARFYSGESDYSVINVNQARFSVDDILLFNPDYIKPTYISISYIKNHDGTSPFEPGKQYAVFGSYQQGFAVADLVLPAPFIDVTSIRTGEVNSNDELNKILGINTNAWVFGYSLNDDVFPIEVVEYLYDKEFDRTEIWTGIINIDKPLDEIMSSPIWLPMEEAIDRAGISAKSFHILSTNDPNSLPRFNQNRNLFDEGRTFTRKEIREGARVCLVSRQFAEFNDLSVGDILPLQLYNSVLGETQVTYVVSESTFATGYFWIPSVFQEGLEISEPLEFEITGIYNTMRVDRSEYAVPINTIIIPDKSFETLTGEPISLFDATLPAPILLNSMIIPNGKINESIAAINNIAEGYGTFFRFYDQGYDSLRTILNNLRFGMTWILSLAAAAWLAVLIIFLMFYVTRKRKEAALLYAIGISRGKRFYWVFVQCLILVLISLGISTAVSLPIYGDILDIAAGVAQEFTESFRNLQLSDAADSGLRSTIPLNRSSLALIITIAGASVLTLTAAGLLSGRSVTFKALGEKRGDD